jgi:hypothetical protein
MFSLAGRRPVSSYIEMEISPPQSYFEQHGPHLSASTPDYPAVTIEDDDEKGESWMVVHNLKGVKVRSFSMECLVW